jgi:DNA-binding NtrC family response regulator
MKLLLIDDDAATLEVMTGAFERRGIAVVPCGDPQQVEQALAGEPSVGAIVTDLRMPGLDGFEVLRQAGDWSRARGTDLPVFVVTGHGTVEEEQRAMALGARLFLRKPLDLPVLLGHVRAVLQPATAGAAR